MRLYWWKEKNNFGDMLSPLICEWMGAKPEYCETSPKVLAVGSILDRAGNDDIIWGSGVQIERDLPSRLDVRAVRGPVTANFIRKYGFDVPDVYGDPALLLPVFYTPRAGMPVRELIVPNIVDVELKRFAKERQLPILDIAVDEPLDIVDAICSAEFVITSSLHALIVAESYDIKVAYIHYDYYHKPSLRAMDYLYSTGRGDIVQYGLDPKPITEKPIFPDLKRLMDAFPFELC